MPPFSLSGTYSNRGALDRRGRCVMRFEFRCWGGRRRRHRERAGASVAEFGCGAVGSLATWALHHERCRTLIAKPGTFLVFGAAMRAAHQVPPSDGIGT